MPRITSISVRPLDPGESDGLKGLTYDQPLAPCTLIVGPNGAGKTTRGPLAIAAAIEGLATVPTDGRRPYIGRAPINTVVRLALDSGAVVERLLDAQRGRAVDAANEAARIHIGIPPTAWNLSDFASGTSGDRGRILDAVARAGGTLDGWNGARCVAAIEGRIEDTIPDLVHDLPVADDGAAWLRAALSWAEKHQTATNTAQRDAEGAARAAAARVPQDIEDIAALDSEIETLVALQATDGARARHLAEGSRLRASIQSGRLLGERSRTPDDEPRDHSRRDPIAPPDGPRPNLTALKATEAAAQAALDAVIARHRDLERQRADAERQAIATEARAGTHDGDLQACVHCGATDPLGRSRVRDRVLAEAAEHRAAAQSFAARLAELLTEGAAARAAHRTAADAVVAVEAEARTWDARQRESTSRAAAIEHARESHARAILAWQAREQRRLEDLAAAEQGLSTASDLLADWQSRDIPAGAPDGTETALQGLRARRDAARSGAGAKSSAAAAWTRYEAARDAWDRARAIVQAVRDTRDEMASAAYGPVRDAARALLAGVEADGLPMPYFDDADAYGAVVRGVRVPYAALSESEQRVTASALVYALATVARCPVRLVLLDGLEVVQRDHRAPLLAALARAVQAGLADTVVATMATAPGEDVSDLIAVDGLTVVEVSS